jgi:hypothetical protein
MGRLPEPEFPVGHVWVIRACAPLASGPRSAANLGPLHFLLLSALLAGVAGVSLRPAWVGRRPQVGAGYAERGQRRCHAGRR